MKELRVEASVKNLPIVFRFVLGELENCGCSKKTMRAIKLSVEEVFVNIAQYAYDPKTGPAIISMEVVRDPDPVRVIISFADTGKPFDPLVVERPDTSLPLEQREVGGLGVFLVRTHMDWVHYGYQDGMNILTIEKNLQEVAR